VKRADELAERYGDRFRPTPYLRELAAKGEGFPA
jgi:3-hydroxyacyl-CoA dehydrogenase/enoyl-CoA hydratase/3-hydroxybutyryl-CoA epimerase